MSSESSSRTVHIEEISRDDNREQHNSWKARLPELNKVCTGLTKAALNQSYGIIETIAYTKTKTGKLTSFALLYRVHSGRTIDKKVKTVKFLVLKIICSGVLKRGYGTRLMTEIAAYARESGFEYLIVEEPTESALPFYIKQGYNYMEMGTIDGIMVFDSCFKQLYPVHQDVM